MKPILKKEDVKNQLNIHVTKMNCMITKTLYN
jgi:hypothetical protein